MLTATVLLAWQGWLPLWLAAAIVLRDVVIASGAIAYRLVVGHVEMEPTWLSKINTALEFTALAGLLGHAAALIDGSDCAAAVVRSCLSDRDAVGHPVCVDLEQEGRRGAAGSARRRSVRRRRVGRRGGGRRRGQSG